MPAEIAQQVKTLAKAWGPKFDPWDARSRVDKWELTLAGCPQTSMCMYMQQMNTCAHSRPNTFNYYF